MSVPNLSVRISLKSVTDPLSLEDEKVTLESTPQTTEQSTPQSSTPSVPRKRTLSEKASHLLRKMVGISEEKKEYQTQKSTKCTWRKFYNEDRYYHAHLEVQPKVDEKKVKEKAEVDRKNEEVKKEKERAELIGTAVLKANQQKVFREAAQKAINLKQEKHTKSASAIDLFNKGPRHSELSVRIPGTPADSSLLSPKSCLSEDDDEDYTPEPFVSGYVTETNLDSECSSQDLSEEDYTLPKPIPKKEMRTDANEENFVYYLKPENAKKGTRKGRRIVFFDGKLKRVSNIDTANEVFRVVFHFYLTWLMSKKEVEEYYGAKATVDNFDEWEPNWKPQLECDNKIEGNISRVGAYKCKVGTNFKCLPGQNPKKDFTYAHGKTSFDIQGKDLGFDPRWAFWCRVQYNCELLCAEELELEFFPFDCQDLGVYLRLKQKADKCDIVAFPRHGEIFNIDARYSMISEWRIPGVLLEFEQGDPIAAKDGIPYNSVILRVKAERKWQAHLADSITIFCMFWLGLATFGIPVEDVGDRLAYCITLLLADIATMQLLNETTPTIPYRTFLDTYTYACFLFLVAITIFITLSGFGGRPRLGHVMDWWGFWICFLIVLAMHIWCLRWIYKGRTEERGKLVMDSDGLEKYFKEHSHINSITSMPNAGVYWDGRSIAPTNEWKNEKFYKERGIEPPPTLERRTRWISRSYPWSQRNDDAYAEFSPWTPEYAKKELKTFTLPAAIKNLVSQALTPIALPGDQDEVPDFSGIP